MEVDWRIRREYMVIASSDRKLELGWKAVRLLMDKN